MNIYAEKKPQRNRAKSVKVTLLTLFAIFLCLIISACRSYDLTKDQIQEFKVEFCNEDNNEYIIISGVPFHSALVIERIIITASNSSSINVMADMRLCGSEIGIGLPFYLKIQIYKNIDTVTLGKDKEIIWERNTGIQEDVAKLSHK